MTHLIIKKKNEVFVTIESEQYVYHELSDHFTFEVPGAKFMPQYRNKYWDGKIRLYDMRRNEIYAWTCRSSHIILQSKRLHI